MKAPNFTNSFLTPSTYILELDMALLVSNILVSNNDDLFLALYNVCTPVGELAKLILAANIQGIWVIWPQI